ncbi:uncharacterized protein LOC120263779 isoform X2 [Dioscorea cayenensis subsp. rotundata]|uniref:Uncharacterized protein LOC120263779 isoform X2 n=1 Tax=Dioscorea cayennensis subsp. rotundata TaxID=55577 RepID=A0AB40BJW6_DIOCR|nr:uncharacterized protein LOC120263779 isoform X2 [Dioscorea cayenensis subsp. rotundata]
MVQLYLSKPVADASGDGDLVEGRLSLLQRLESIIWSIITLGGRYEARLWLCNTISCIQCITSRNQCELFRELLRSKPAKHDVAAQLLRMILEKSPGEIGPVIAKKSYLLEKFFEGHKKGARALSQFAFVNRDMCWEELEWKGSHGQSPAVVATKPHYFHDLDVLHTVENFLEYVPDFWSSHELAESLRDGEIFKIDTQYFVDQFIKLLYEENFKELWAAVEKFLTEEQYSYLCQHLLVLLDEHELLAFLKSVSKYIFAGVQHKDFGYPSGWLEYLLSTSSDMTLNELFLLNAVISHGRKLLHLLSDEEHAEENGRLEELLRTASMFSDADHWALIRECMRMQKKVAIKWAGLHSWALHYCLSKECKTRESCESIFIKNGIGFQKADDYTLINNDGYQEIYGSGADDKGSRRTGGQKRKRDKKKRRRNKNDHEEWNSDGLEDFKTLNGQETLKLEERSWLLSTDGYSCSWHIADLPEHLARYCFLTWMKWIYSKW